MMSALEVVDDIVESNDMLTLNANDYSSLRRSVKELIHDDLRCTNLLD